MQLVDCVDIEMSSSHRQCRWVIDEKISGRIVISSIERRDYSAWRSSDSSIMLIYWERLELIFFTWRQVIHLFMWKIESSREWSERILFHWSESNIERLRSHVYTNNSFNVYVTQVKSREGKNYSVHHTLSFHRVRLSFIIYFSAQWMTIIERENAAIDYNHEHHGCKGNVFVFEPRIGPKHRL